MIEPTRQVVLAGAGHAHLGLIHAIPRLISQDVSVTVIDPNPVLWYSGMMPAVLGGRVDVSTAEIGVRTLVERYGGRYVTEAVEKIDSTERIAHTPSGLAIAWDVLSVAVGSTVVAPFPVATDGETSVFAAKPISRLPDIYVRVAQLTASLERPSVRVAFIGGGPSAVELAGNLTHRIAADPHLDARRVAIRIYTRADRLLSQMPAKAATIAAQSLSSHGVEVRCGVTVRAVSDGRLELNSGDTEHCDIVVLTTGLSSPDVLRRSGLSIDSAGSLRVDRTLRMSDAPIYGGGDCITIDGMPLPRAGVHAVRQQKVLLHNISRELGVTHGATRNRAPVRPPFFYSPPQNPMLIINLGDGTAILVRGQHVRHGRLPFLLKERIDWGFVRSEGRSISPSWVAPPRPGDNRDHPVP